MVLCAGHIAEAQTGRDPAVAESLFRAGQQALAKGDFETGCAKFRASMELDPAPSTPAELTATMRAETARVSRIIKAAGIVGAQ